VNESGIGNTAIGNAALTANQSGNANTAIGVESMLANINGAENVGDWQSSIKSEYDRQLQCCEW
jgi:hypothetical protein